MDTQTLVRTHSDRLAGLIGERLGIRGQGLKQKLRRAGRALPAWVRRDAGRLLDAERLTAHPKMARQIDPGELTKASERVEKWLMTIDRAERRKDRILKFLATNVLNFLVVGAAFLSYVVWAGYL